MSTANTIGIDPAALFAIRDLELRARVVVEGLWSGLHRSPLEGFSVEFTEYRNYSPGDDLRYLDWKVLGKTDQEFIKKFEERMSVPPTKALEQDHGPLAEEFRPHPLFQTRVGCF